MTLEQELELSYYNEIAPINDAHRICLVQDVRTRNICIKKTMTVYHAEVYEELMRHPIPNTPRIQAMGESGGELTVIEQYLPGLTLEEHLQARGIFSEAEVLDILLQLCTIVKAFHHCVPPIVNRDLKPSNLKLNEDGVLKLLDLNAARICSPDCREDTVLLGTRGYAAPEQYGFGASTVQTDLYAIGVLANVLLTGCFPKDRLAEGRFRKIIHRCTQIAPRDRYQSIEALEAALKPGSVSPDSASNHAPHRFLPPGFQSRNPFVWIASGLQYSFLFGMILHMEVSNATAAQLKVCRIGTLLMTLAIILFTGDYCGVQSRCAFLRNRHGLGRFVRITLADLLIFAVTVLLLAILL